MKINIKLPSSGEPRSLEQSIKKQLSELFKKNACIAEADVKLSYEAGHENNKVCKIYLKTEQKNIFTIQKGSSFESSTTKAINKLQGQLNTINNTL